METVREGIFENIGEVELREMIACFRPIVKKYRKGDLIMTYTGSETKKHICLVLRGSARLEAVNAEGAFFNIELFMRGEIFGEMFTLPTDTTEYSVRACEFCSVIFFDYDVAMRPCENLCDHHSRFMSNLFLATARKTGAIAFRLSILGRKRTRDKLLLYINHIRVTEGASLHEPFTLPISLSALADYLMVDRSAMMRELKHLKEERYLSGDGRTFVLHMPTEEL